MSAELHRLSVGGTELKYVDAGSGETVVLVHGAVSDHRFWRAQLVALAPSYRCIALDQRYFGSAPWPDDGSNYSLSTHSEDLAGFIRQVARNLPVHLVGTSYGSTGTGGSSYHRTAVSPQMLSLFQALLGSCPGVARSAGPVRCPRHRRGLSRGGERHEVDRRRRLRRNRERLRQRPRHGHEGADDVLDQRA